MSDSSKQFQFVIADGTVTAYFEIDESGQLASIPIGENAVFTVEPGAITLTEDAEEGSRVTVFADGDGDGLFVIASRSDDDESDTDEEDDETDDEDEPDGPEHGGHGNHQLFAFDIVGGEVTAAYKVHDGMRVTDPITPHESYQLDGDEVVYTETMPFGTEIIHFADSDGDGFYQRVSEQWISEPTAHHAIPMPVMTHMLRFSSTDGDDDIAVVGGDDAAGGIGDDRFVIREAAHLRIEDFNVNEDDEIVFDTGLGLRSFEHLASFVTGISQSEDELVINFGNDVSLTLVGVTLDQMSADDVVVLS